LEASEHLCQFFQFQSLQRLAYKCCRCAYMHSRERAERERDMHARTSTVSGSNQETKREEERTHDFVLNSHWCDVASRSEGALGVAHHMSPMTFEGAPDFFLSLTKGHFSAHPFSFGLKMTRFVALKISDSSENENDSRCTRSATSIVYYNSVELTAVATCL